MTKKALPSTGYYFVVRSLITEADEMAANVEKLSNCREVCLAAHPETWLSETDLDSTLDV